MALVYNGHASYYIKKKKVTFGRKAAVPMKKRLTVLSAHHDLLIHRRFLHAADRRLMATAKSEGVGGLEFTGAHNTAGCSCLLSPSMRL